MTSASKVSFLAPYYRPGREFPDLRLILLTYQEV
jgi:hypothetical protein